MSDSLIGEIKLRARGRWQTIYTFLAKCNSSLFDGKHHPCPKCGGTDRFRFSDMNGDGSVICNQCGRDIGDGIAGLMWLNGEDLKTTLRYLAEHLQIGKSAATNGNITKPIGIRRASQRRQSLRRIRQKSHQPIRTASNQRFPDGIQKYTKASRSSSPNSQRVNRRLRSMRSRHPGHLFARGRLATRTAKNVLAGKPFGLMARKRESYFADSTEKTFPHLMTFPPGKATTWEAAPKDG